MVTLTDDAIGVTVEGENEKDALKKMRVERRKAAEKQKAIDAIRAQAGLNARSNGFRVYDLLMEKKGEDGKPFPPAWEFASTSSRWFLEMTDGGSCLSPFVKVRIDGERGNGYVSLFRDSWQVVGVVFNGAGFAMLIFIRDMYHPDKEVVCHAVGVEGEEVVIERMHGITPDMFRAFKD